MAVILLEAAQLVGGIMKDDGEREVVELELVDGTSVVEKEMEVMGLGNNCSGICEKHRAKRPVKRNNGRFVGGGRGFGVGRYASGQKRCQRCAIWISWDGIFCPCCNQRLRTHPRMSISKVFLVKHRSGERPYGQD